MTVSRVTSQTQWAALQSDLAGAARRTANASEQISTGRRINRVSDAPTDSSSVLRIDEQTSALAAYAKQATDSNAWLATADAALQDVSAVMSEALGTTKAALNGGLDSSGRGALADQLAALSDRMFELASTTQLGRPVFGAFGTAAVSRDAAGVVTYTGGSGDVQRQVSPTLTIAVNVNGADAFGFSGGDDVFKVLKDAESAVRTGDLSAAQVALGRLDARQNDALTALQRVGATQNRVDAATNRADSLKLSLAAARSDLVDIDIPKAAMDMQLAQDGYDAVLAAISRVARMPSLSELLR